MRSLQAFTFLSGTSVTSGSSCEYKRFQAAKFEMQQTMNCTFLKLPTNSNGGESVASACDINVIYVVYRIYINTYLYTYVYRHTYVCIYMLIQVMLFVTCICDDVGFQHCLQQLKETVIEDIRTKNQLFFPYKKDTALRYHTSHLNPSHHLIASASNRNGNRNGNRIGLSICFLPMLGSKTSHQYDLVTAPTFGFAGVVRRRQVSQCLEVLLACLNDIA